MTLLCLCVQYVKIMLIRCEVKISKWSSLISIVHCVIISANRGLIISRQWLFQQGHGQIVHNYKRVINGLGCITIKGLG